MAIFKFEVFKSLGRERWGNTYLIASDTLVNADAYGIENVVPFEQQVHDQRVTFEESRTSTLTPNDGQFITTVLGGTGDATYGEYLPLYNTVRVDITRDGVGRSARKYYRTPVPEGEQDNGVLSTTFVNAFNTAINDLIATGAVPGTHLCLPDGDAWLAGSTRTAVQMRQLHRKRRRSGI